jgi:hypothetical protein
VANLTLAALLLQQIKAGGADSAKLQKLLDTAQNLGIADTPVVELTGSKK